MKKIFSICLLTAYSTFAVEQPDSIIVNAGKNSRVIFYGKTQQDLKNIERLDLNKLLRDLNQKQDSANAVSNHLQMSSESYQTHSKVETTLAELQKKHVFECPRRIGKLSFFWKAHWRI